MSNTDGPELANIVGGPTEPTKPRTWRRWIVVSMVVLAVAFYAVAYFQPMWGFYLFAPQYPDGLILSIYLTEVRGDITEINILNHYIGMARLDEAAKLERSLAVYGVCGIGLATLLLAFLPSRRNAHLFALPAALFPLVFTVVMYFWMYRFGHELDPSAPVTVQPFTPTLIGKGEIGNFKTIGLPGPGYYLIIGSAVLAMAAFFIRRHVCKECAFKDSCKHRCPGLFVSKAIEANKSEKPS